MKKNFTSGINILMLLVLISMMGCETIYIPDPIDPRLPKYSESGYNVAGALIGDRLWKWRNDYVFFFGSTNDPMVRYRTGRDSLSIQLRGFMEEDTQTYFYISFGLQNTGVNTVSSLIRLGGKKVQLGDGINMASVDDGTGCNGLGTGQIYFRSVKYNATCNCATLSGTFSFDTSSPDCAFAPVTYGRFDMKVYYIDVI